MNGRDVHLVGSIPLADADAVFAAVASHIGDHVRRIPDGETGERAEWTAWQWHAFAANPSLQSTSTAGDHDASSAQFRLRPGARSEDVHFTRLGYADAAIASFARFAKLKASGAIASKVRFQVSMPTPVAVVSRFIVPDERAALEAWPRQFRRPIWRCGGMSRWRSHFGSGRTDDAISAI